MECLKVRDIICLSTFKCKICNGRLRTPILQVNQLGNICGRCYERSVYINVTPNLEIEDFLGKLYVPCNFAERGCTFQADYGRTCDHETYECRFRDKICVFAYEHQQCEYEYQSSKDLIDHIQEGHKESVLIVKDDLVQVENPTETHPNRFYLLQAGNTFVLLRIMLNALKERIYYTFYHFDDVEPRDIDISSPAFDDWDEDVEIMHESMVSCKFPTGNAFIVTFSKLEELDFLKTVKINICVEKTAYAIEKVKMPIISKWVKCKGCFKIVDNIAYCNHCKKTVCWKCIPSGKCSCRHLTVTINLATLGACSEFLCENTDCNKVIRGDLYDIHNNYQCFKKEYKCGYNDCLYKGFLREYVQHVMEAHKCCINKQILLIRAKEIKLDYTNGDDLFCHTYYLTEQNELEIKTIKLTEPFWTDDYICVITIKSESTYQSVTTQSDYTSEGYKKKLNLGDTLDTSASLTVEAVVRRI